MKQAELARQFVDNLVKVAKAKGWLEWHPPPPFEHFLFEEVSALIEYAARGGTDDGTRPGQVERAAGADIPKAGRTDKPKKPSKRKSKAEARADA